MNGGERDHDPSSALSVSASSLLATIPVAVIMGVREPHDNPRDDAVVEILISESEIHARVAELGRRIEADYQGKPLTIVAVLTGSLIVLADLIRRIHIPLRVALLQAGSYKGATTSAGALVVNEAFAPEVTGRDVLLLDDILDTGHTLATLVERIGGRGALSIRTAVLLRKIGWQEVAIEPDYCGFTIPDRFVVGYGLDYDDDYRHLPYVGVLNPEP